MAAACACASTARRCPSRWSRSATGRSCGTSCATTPTTATATSSCASATGRDAIKDYFLHYDEAVSNDFVLTEGGRRVELLGSDIADWRITFADTGLDTTIGERLRRVRHLLDGRGHVPGQLRRHPDRRPARRAGRARSGRDTATAHVPLRPRRRTTRSSIVETNGDRRVTRLVRPLEADFWINGGYFTLRQEVFDVIEPGDELVEAPFGRLIDARAAARRPATRGSGRRWTRCASSSTSSRWPAAGRAAVGARGWRRPRGSRRVDPARHEGHDRGARPAGVARSADPRGRRPRRRRGDRRRRHRSAGSSPSVPTRPSPGSCSPPRSPSARPRRGRARSASSTGVAEQRVDVRDLRDGYLPFLGEGPKEAIAAPRRRWIPT